MSPSIRTEIFSSGKHRGRPKPGAGYAHRLGGAVLTSCLALALAVAFTIAGIIAPQPSGDGPAPAPPTASAGTGVASPVAQQNLVPRQSPSSQAAVKAVKAVLTRRPVCRARRMRRQRGRDTCRRTG